MAHFRGIRVFLISVSPVVESPSSPSVAPAGVIISCNEGDEGDFEGFLEGMVAEVDRDGGTDKGASVSDCLAS